MLRRPRGRERIALVCVLTAGCDRARAPRSPYSSAVRSAAGARSSRDAGAPRRAVAGGGLLRCLRERCRPDRARRRRPRRRHPREAPDRPRRRARPAAARRIRSDARLRLPDRIRPVPGRLPIVVVAGSRRAVARRGTVRRAHRHARAEVDRSKAARGGGDARRPACTHLAGDRPTPGGTRLRDRSRVRVRDRARRVRRDRLRRPRRAADAARRDLSVPRSTRGRESGGCGGARCRAGGHHRRAALVAERFAEGRGQAL